MTIGIGGVGSQNIAVPFPAPVAGIKFSNNNNAQRGANYVASPINDGSYIGFPTSASGSVVLYSKTSTALYTIAPSAINASATDWCAFAVDTTNGVIWAVAGNATSGQGYLGTINYTTGAVTAVGTGFTGQTNTLGASGAKLATAFAELGTGTLTVWQSTGWSFVLNTSTGAVATAESQLITNGSSPGLNYPTADHSTFVNILSAAGLNASATGIAMALNLWRNGTLQVAFFGTTELGGFGLPSVTSAIVNVLEIGSNIALCGIGSTSYDIDGPRYFTRTAFDAWLKQVANNLGMP